jgi:Zn-dependent protease
MTITNQGSIRLFRLAGIDVYLHWLWFLVAYWQIRRQGVGDYTSPAWNVLEYLALFCIVLMHEFGHSLACRQVGGRADHITLWPLGGVAFVQPPERPLAMLWSIAAGPLVNVILTPVLLALTLLMAGSGAAEAAPNAARLLQAILTINLVLLIFNLLPIYPLDGGQMLRSLLWLVIGRARSLTVATAIGFVGVVGLGLLALVAQGTQRLWLGVITVFILMNCWAGLLQGLRLTRISRAPRRRDLACPACHTAPPAGAFWVCGRCRKSFDAFENRAVCPHCGTAYEGTRCFECGSDSPIRQWYPLAQPLPSPTANTLELGPAREW